MEASARAPAMSSGQTPAAVIDSLMIAQGRKYRWLAERAGMRPQYLEGLMAGRSYYRWRPGQKEAIADALGVPVAMIWGDNAAAAAAVVAEEVGS